MKFHNTYSYILNPPHKVTVCLIGCGGTGSQVLSILGRMDLSLKALGHIGLHVTVYDDDKVSEANVGRQLFSDSDVGFYKSDILVDRFNRFYGTKWTSVAKRFASNKFDVLNDQKYTYNHNIYISCVDDFKTRIDLGETLRWMTDKNDGEHDHKLHYWLDFGNTNNTGQAILGTLSVTDDWMCSVQMDCFDTWASVYKKPKKTKNVPSCSLAEALEKQDLLINSTLANAGMNLIWRLFRHGRTPYRGVIINLDTLTSNPIKV